MSVLLPTPFSSAEEKSSGFRTLGCILVNRHQNRLSPQVLTLSSSFNFLALRPILLLLSLRSCHQDCSWSSPETGVEEERASMPLGHWKVISCSPRLRRYLTWDWLDPVPTRRSRIVHGGRTTGTIRVNTSREGTVSRHPAMDRFGCPFTLILFLAGGGGLTRA